MIRASRAAAAALAVAALPGCCWTHLAAREPETLVVVVPSRHDGHVGAVVVHQGDRTEVLDTAYAAARVGGHGELRRSTVTADDTARVFAAASEALPPKAVSYTLYFMLASNDLTPDSSAMLDRLLQDVAARPAAEVVVIGHTDRMGTDERNDALSLRRARHVRDLVIRRGAQPDRVSVVGMGEREPIVDTPDGVAEARNRRVEIVVR